MFRADTCKYSTLKLLNIYIPGTSRKPYFMAYFFEVPNVYCPNLGSKQHINRKQTHHTERITITNFFLVPSFSTDMHFSTSLLSLTEFLIRSKLSFHSLNRVCQWNMRAFSLSPFRPSQFDSFLLPEPFCHETNSDFRTTIQYLHFVQYKSIAIWCVEHLMRSFNRSTKNEVLCVQCAH